MRRSPALRLLPGLAVAAAAGCADAPPTAPPTDDGLAAIRVSANVSNTPIDLLVIEVSAADFPQNAVFNLPVVDGVASGTLRLPPGPGRLFLVTAYDAAGEVTHEGSAVRDVNRGPNPPLTIVLTPRSGQIPVTISFGSFGVVVTPSSADVDLSVDPGLQLGVQVTDAEGTLVADAAVTWATTNPALAQVNDVGFVTGLRQGSVQIVAMYEGVAGVSAISIFATTWYADADADGFGDPATGQTLPAGTPPPPGTVALGGDCDDGDPAIYPGATEMADGMDNDCDGVTDEILHWQDADGDGFGDPTITTEFELGFAPAGWIAADGSPDCNDSDPAIHPGATEIAGDAIDSDCDGVPD